MKKGFLVPVTLCASFSCQANDYFFQPVISSSERYTSNLLLRPTSTGNWISKLSPGLNVGLRTENIDLKSNFTWNQLFYTNDTALNISEQLFNIDYQHRRGRLQWGLDGSFNNQSSINSLNTVQGLAFTQVMVKQFNIAPTVSYALNELSTVSLNYSYSKATYEKSQNTFLYDYDYQQLSSTFTHLYTEHDKLNATVSGSRYNAPVRGLTTFNEVGQLGWQHSFDEQLVTYVSAGINYSQTELQLPSYPLLIQTTDNFDLILYKDPITGQLFTSQKYSTASTTNTNGIGGVFQASVQKSFEKGSVALAISQNQSPTSQGLQTQSQVTLTPTYTINERWSSSLSTNYSLYKMPTAQNASISNDRTYASVSPNINWKWTPEVNVGVSYTYRQQEIKSASQVSIDNGVQLQLTYQPTTNYQVK
ncbi:MAG: hypothetical protein WCS87_16515 [Methylococcaceae bacterium]